VTYSDNPGEYVVHAIYRGLKPENLPYFFRIKYICMYFSNCNAENLGTCECDDIDSTSESEQYLDSAAEYEADAEEAVITDVEAGDEAGSEAEEESESGNEPEAEAEPVAQSKIFSDPSREEEKKTRATGQAPSPVSQEPQQQQAEKRQGQVQRPQENQEPQQCQLPRQPFRLSELLQSRQVEYLSRSPVPPVLSQQENVQLLPQQTLPQRPKQGQTQQAQAQARIHAPGPQNLQSLQAQTSPGAAPFLSPLPPPQPATQWSNSVFSAWNTFQTQTLEGQAPEAREEARWSQVRQLLANSRVRAGEDLVSPTVAPSLRTGYWAPATISGPSLPLLASQASQAQQQQATPNGQYECLPNKASDRAMCDPSVALGLLRDRPNIGDMEEYLESRYGTRYGNRRM